VGLKNTAQLEPFHFSGLFIKIMTGWWCNNHLEKYEFVNGKDAIPYMKWNIKFMFETTNQIMINWFVSLG